MKIFALLILLAACLPYSVECVADPLDDPRYCGEPRRNAQGEIVNIRIGERGQ